MNRVIVSLACIATVVGACAHLSRPETPQSLAAPGGEALLFRSHARGVQNYECGTGKAGPEWIFKGPEAALLDDEGRAMGKHYGGPTWESPDGSKVVGQLVAAVDADDANAIPLLLLKAKSASGEGRFGKVQSIQRLATVGGKAPRDGCTQGESGRRAAIPYSAVYYFYGRQ